MAFTRIGYGQVEPNQLSGIKTGQIYASLPLDARSSSKVDVLQNGEFMYYDTVTGVVTAEPNTNMADVLEPYLVYNEIKLYEDWLSYKDFAMIRVGDNYVTSAPMIGRLTSENADGTVYGDGAQTVGVNPNPAHTEYGYRMEGIAPRLVKTNVGDIYTTNMVALTDDTTPLEYAVGDVLKLIKTDRHTLELTKKDVATGTPLEVLQFIVAKVYTMPDGQPGLKVQRIK